MSCAAGPKITNDGLVLCIDASNSKSYIGSGPAWKDVCGINNHATMIGTVPYSTDTVPCFDFATAIGAGAYASSLGFSLTSSINTALGNYTFECWVKNLPAASQAGLLSNSGGGDGFRFGPCVSDVYFLCGTPYTEGAIGYTAAINNSIWHHIVLVFDRLGTTTGSVTTPNMYLYLDGVFQNSTALPANQIAQYTGIPGIVNSACCTIWKGKLSRLCIYNKILSSNDVSINFRAQKSRYGV